MLYVKLTLRNLSHSIKEYTLFMATMTMSMTLMYAFFAMALSDRILNIYYAFENFLPIVIFASMGVIMVLGWMIVYITDFIMKKRSREFGLYLLSGMKRINIALMFSGEQLIMGAIAFVMGCIMGVLMSQALEAVLLQLFSQEYHFVFAFSFEAFMLTFVCFLFIYILEVIREIRQIHRCTLKELFYRKDQHTIIQVSKTKSVIYFIAGVICMAICFFIYYLFYLSLKDSRLRIDIYSMIVSIFMMILSIYLIYKGISQVVMILLQKWKEKKYKGNMMFICAQLCTKIKRNRFVLATISVLTILIISLLVMSLQLENIYDKKAKEDVPFDIMAYSSETLQENVLYDYLHAHHISYKDHFYQIYQSDALDENLKDMLLNTAYGYPGLKTYVIKESDIQALLKLKGYTSNEMLGQNQYGLIVTPELKKVIEPFMNQVKVNIDNKQLSCAYIENSRIGQAVYVDYYLVLPDQYVENFDIKANVLVMDVDNPIPDSLYDDTISILDYQNEGLYLYRIKPNYIKEQLSIYTMIIFSLLYVSMIAICILATIIATQQLSDMNEQKEIYQMMWKMGCDKKDIRKLLFYQISFYFIIPLILPCLYLPFVFYGMHHLLTIIISEIPIMPSIIFALIIFLIIYGCYFVLTYQSCKHTMEG